MEAGDLRFFPPVENHFVRSRANGRHYRVQVATPARTAGDYVPLPVVYAPDANLNFGVLLGLARAWQMARPSAPGFILVGIGYPGESPAAGLALRAIDFSFPGFPDYLQTTAPWSDVLDPGDLAKCGARHFLDFLGDELVPLINERYPTDGQNIYCGHSSAATFGLYCLRHRPALFSDHIWTSPALCFEGEDAQGVTHVRDEFGLDLARELIATWEETAPRRVYLAAGSDEEFDGAARRWRFTSAYYQLAAMLSNAALPGLELATDILLKEVHTTVWPTAFLKGIRHVLGTGPRHATVPKLSPGPTADDRPGGQPWRT